VQAAADSQCVPARAFQPGAGWLLGELVPGNYSLRVRAATLAQRAPYTRAVHFVVPAPRQLATWLVVLVACACSLVALGLGLCALIALYKRRFSRKCDQYLMGIFSANPDYISQVDVYTPDEWELDRQQVTLLREIGRGSFGT